MTGFRAIPVFLVLTGSILESRSDRGFIVEVLDAIRTTRSVRLYKKRSVNKETVMGLLDAANLAPSATNRQPWGFVVVNRFYLDQLSEVLTKAFNERVRMASEETMREAIRELPNRCKGKRTS